MDAIELLLHPVRLRIVAILSSAPDLTTTQLCARLKDVSKVTVYRQIAVLVEGGAIEVAGEQRVRGAVERRYRLRPERPSIGPDLAAGMSLDDHRRGFAAAMAVLLAEFDAYLDRDDADPVADGVGYRQATLWLTREELDELGGEMREILLRATANEPAPGRIPYLLSPVVFPLAGGGSPEPTDPAEA